MLKNKLLLFGFLLLIFSCENKNSPKLRIATSANMHFAINELVKKFTRLEGIECEVIVGSSGKLTAQINEGAPFDVFVSANMKYPNDLYKKGLTKEKPKVYAHGKLVLWTLKNDIIPSLKLLENIEIKHIALANPKIAPYGIATKETLISMGLWNNMSKKVVRGENIAQAFQFIKSRNAELGFVSF